MDKRCPRKLNSLPNEPCSEGRKGVDCARKGEEGGCPWFIADREANYCSFKYLADNGKPLETAKVARLCMIDDSEVKKIVAKFRKIAIEDGGIF